MKELVDKDCLIITHNRSQTSNEIMKRLQSKGYCVTEKMTGCLDPVVTYSNTCLVGAPQINSFFFSETKD
ncbi:MAG: hypothetical protein GY714_09160 [Desulfobacterales bacterium]|nr:hypothetical protein [Desulfobacterales bacterium]